MRNYIKALIIGLLLTTPFSMHAKAEERTDINALIENAKALDGKDVIVQGEAIGERMNRGDYTWVNINDGTNAIGIWVNKNDADKILHYGNYENIGDIVKITGIFNRACKEHGGEADLHSISLELVDEGYQVKEQVSVAKMASAGVLILIALGLLIILIRKIKIKRL